ncbi:MAG: hypothetical protein Q9162_002053 [Coniocarpon cinnabarinum]
MFQTFTGNSRRPRQVNLSGRTANPLAKYGAAPSATSDTVANAHQSRLERQQERARNQAATKIQKSWRGYKVRDQLKQEQRRQWEATEGPWTWIDELTDDDFQPYSSATEAYLQLSRVLRFFDWSDGKDHQILVRSSLRIQKGIDQDRSSYVDGPWPAAYLRLQNTTLDGLARRTLASVTNGFFRLLRFTTRMIPDLTASNAENYYKVLKGVLDRICLEADILAAPLQALGSATERAHQAFAVHFLTIPNLGKRLTHPRGAPSSFETIAHNIDCKLLANSLLHLLQESGHVTRFLSPKTSVKSSRSQRSFNDLTQDCAWLAAHLVCLHQRTFGAGCSEQYISDPSFISVLCPLLSAIADGAANDAFGTISEVDSDSLLTRMKLDTFIIEQLDALVHQKSISSLVSQMNADQISTDENTEARLHQSTASKALATYILTLLRVFPNRGDDIRMWLYVGSSSSFQTSSGMRGESAIRFFWLASRNTSIFKKILYDPRSVIDLLKPRTTADPRDFVRERPLGNRTQSVEDEWQIVLLFVEMYSFVLKVMDDEEFFAYDDSEDLRMGATYSRKNSLRRDEIMTLSTFLKHLGFSMYYHAADIIGSRDEESSKDISSLFKPPGQDEPDKDKLDRQNSVAVVSGVNLDYMKGAVTGLARAIYERDSRRPFTPKDHWLMTTRFDMTNFIDAVVEEEERRHQVEEAERVEEDDNGEEHWDVTRSPGLVGTGHAQRLQRLDRLWRQRRKESRKRYLQAVAPRLEILQNMPFLIPFTTRVQIFRRFVQLDQLKRRSGASDPEAWRLIQMASMNDGHGRLERHHAMIRRGHEFDDAFVQFYELGPSLKEPINITFLDQFEQEEAGIDGGGVTKEFLTSVTDQAFSDDNGVRLFVENDKHLLFPNPTAMDERRLLLLERQGFQEGSEVYNSQMTGMLQRYEFLGRIIGKCLYEGILVDIGFAGFFLLKWALTGGTGTASKESGYRANINDLREFDEGLYQGLLKLKNYPGEVEDFALNFTVADRLTFASWTGMPSEKTITRELRPNGSDIPVTNANRLVYISYMTRHRLSSQPYRQTNAFLKGIGAMISPSWLSMFNQIELQTLVGGAASAINVADLRAHTSYGGVYVIGDDGQEHPSIQLFWKVMESLPDEDRRKVLKFVTSTPRAPLLGFGSLMPRFSIRDSGGDETRLPSTSTCVNLLKLPRYNSFEACRTKLLQAVNAGAGFDLS